LLPLDGKQGSGRASSSKRGSGNRKSASGVTTATAPLLNQFERLYLWGLVPLELATSWVLPHLLGERLPFLPLMLVSLYCSLGMLYAWALLAQQTW
jgi:alpha-1,3-glucosyltransferase